MYYIEIADLRAGFRESLARFFAQLAGFFASLTKFFAPLGGFYAWLIKLSE
ncbi:hypothetical protein [Treponema endosymbiont of Eucomonympha sp.]|uniref:hypothetical protein n=1 Tax=Treponema endosymbiont of Eucomonympha sp. TaxID=1580831 RepID=UPI000B21770A|nr:hypothetical protein [Treponema endosymbiont of Eucomonympha sp.]